jgi:serine protease Do
MSMRGLKLVLAGLTVAAVSVSTVSAQTRPGPQTQQSERIQMPRGSRVSMIGVRMSDVSADQVKTYKLSKAEGAVVEAVNPNSPAATAGLRVKDVIVEFDGERVRSASHLTRLVTETPVGREVTVAVMRDGQRVTLRIKPEANDNWFDPRFTGMIDQEQIREYAEQAGRAAREMRRNLPDMMEGMREGMSTRGRLGVSIQEVTPQLAEYFGVKSGVLVASVAADSPAAKAGLKAGDVITAVDGKAITSPNELLRALPAGSDSGDVTLTIVRDRKEMAVKATLESPSRTGVRL